MKSEKKSLLQFAKRDNAGTKTEILANYGIRTLELWSRGVFDHETEGAGFFFVAEYSAEDFAGGRFGDLVDLVGRD